MRRREDLDFVGAASSHLKVSCVTGYAEVTIGWRLGYENLS